MTRPSNYKIGAVFKVPTHSKVKLKSLKRVILTVVAENRTGPVVIPRGWVDGRLSTAREIPLNSINLPAAMLRVSPRAVGYTHSSCQTLGDWIAWSSAISGLQLKWSELNSFTIDADDSLYKSKLCKFYVKQGILAEREPERRLEVLRNVIDDMRGSADVPY